MSWSIMGRERGANREVELCRVERNPEDMVKAYQEKCLFITPVKGFSGRRVRVPRYEHVHAVEVKGGE